MRLISNQRGFELPGLHLGEECCVNEGRALKHTISLQGGGDDVCLNGAASVRRARARRYLRCRRTLLAASLGEVVEALEGGEKAFLAPTVREGQRTPPERGLISGTDLNRCTLSGLGSVSSTGISPGV